MELDRKVSGYFTFEQTTPSDTWVIQHNLDMYPIVDVYTPEDGEMIKVLPAEVIYDNSNQCTITFSYPVTGYATVV